MRLLAPLKISQQGSATGVALVEVYNLDGASAASK